MALKSEIIDGAGKGNSLRVNSGGDIEVALRTYPPIGQEINPLPFRQYFTDNGTSSGSNDMRVDGSSTSQDFFIIADDEKDIYIKNLSVVIADSTATLSQFGAITALTNGLDFMWVSTSDGEVVIADQLKTNFNFIRLGQGSRSPAFGDGNTVFRADNVSGNIEAYIPTIDLETLFGLRFGVRLRGGSNEKLLFRVNDNITTIDQFDIVAYGIKV